MLAKLFETTIPFTEVQTGIWYPIVEVTFVKADGQRRRLPLLFDTGATQITLHPEWAWLFPQGITEQFNSVGDETAADGLRTQGRIEFLSRTIDCTILLAPLPRRTWMAGLFGRECFIPFGFAFWEKTHELYVNLNP